MAWLIGSWLMLPPPDALVAVAKGRLYLRQRDAVTAQAVRVRLDFVALTVPPLLLTSTMRGTRRNSRSSTQSCIAFRSLSV